MSIGQDPNDPFSQGQVPPWRQQMQLPLLQNGSQPGQQSGFGPVGSLDFAGIQPPQAPPPGISELLASIPTAKAPKRTRYERLALEANRNFGTPLPQRLVGAARGMPGGRGGRGGSGRGGGPSGGGGAAQGGRG